MGAFKKIPASGSGISAKNLAAVLNVEEDLLSESISM